MRLEEPVDPGLQQERTALAWRRTGLALLAGGLTLGRLAMSELGSVVLVPVLLVCAAAGWVVITTLRARVFAVPSRREEGFRHVLHDGILPALVAGGVVVLCVLEAARALDELALSGR